VQGFLIIKRRSTTDGEQSPKYQDLQIKESKKLNKKEIKKNN